ncbi:MAG: hypothetical protein IJB85_00765 [Clostridia bacterium]|nr:hypothetical protein [Clostridia bacterium]
MYTIDLSGTWQCQTSEGSFAAALPGTLDTNGIGHADLTAAPWHPDENCNDALAGADVIATRFTRKYTYEGPAAFTRTLRFTPPADKRVFLQCERSRHLQLHVNDQSVQPVHPLSLSTPAVFEITHLLTGCDKLTLTCDNSYPGWPHDDIVFSSAATDETQTNWNGVIGALCLRIEESTFIAALRVYPHDDTLDVCAEISSVHAWQGEITVASDALRVPACVSAEGSKGTSSVWLRNLPLAQDVRPWDEDEGFLYALSASLGNSSKTVSFGVRRFRAENGRLTLNDRPIFLRSEANCAVFPETGHPPMDTAAWKDILSVYKSYGVNCMRFHSHCPPEAAFTAADEMGMLMQPELSHWNPRNAFSSPESRAYYCAELKGMLRMLANHPSFVMLSLGNELHMDEAGQAFADSLLALAHETDSTRLYAAGSNNHYGARGENPADDFYTSFCYREHNLRATSSPMVGWLNERYPDWRTDYAPAMRAIRAACAQPVISFEVGQYEILPDFDELARFHGVTLPNNLQLIRDKVEAAGLLPRWKAYCEATGELSLLCYRAEIEAALRTQGLSGISLLGLQDFPGQGTALVGMLSSHLAPKPYPFAQPARFARFFTDVLPLALLPRFTYTSAETLETDVRMANYGKHRLEGVPEWTLRGGGLALHGTLAPTAVPCGGLTDLGRISIPLDGVREAVRLTLTLSLCGHENAYSIWVYPDADVVCPENICECRTLDYHALDVLRRGGTVFLAPDSTPEALPHSIKGQFSTDFWSVGTFPAQPGGMGQLIDASHPIFRHFPTDTHTDWQWWPFASQRAVILPDTLRHLQPIVTLMDSYAYLRPMAQLFECRCGAGRLLFSSLNLHNLTHYPETRALLRAIYAYLDSDVFQPAQDISPELLQSLFRKA